MTNQDLTNVIEIIESKKVSTDTNSKKREFLQRLKEFLRTYGSLIVDETPLSAFKKTILKLIIKIFI